MKEIKKCLSDYIPDNQFRYYYTTLPTDLRDTYEKLLEGYLTHKDSITVKVSEINEAWEVHKAICYDVPELFFVKSVKGAFNATVMMATIYPEYRFDYETCFNILRQMEEKTIPFIQRIIMLSEREKAKQIHDYIVRNVTYRDLNAPYSHESPGVLLYGIAVCEGISKAFKYLSDRVNLMSLVVIGDAINNTSTNIESDGHAWNIVYIDLNSYHIDVTFDYSASSRTVIRYDYFLLSDKQIKGDHSFMEAPQCGDNYEYYLLNGHYVENKRSLQNLVRKELRSGSPLIVKTPDFSERADLIAEKLLNTVTIALPLSYSMQSTVLMSYNSSRLIFQFELCD